MSEAMGGLWLLGSVSYLYLLTGRRLVRGLASAHVQMELAVVSASSRSWALLGGSIFLVVLQEARPLVVTTDLQSPRMRSLLQD